MRSICRHFSSKFLSIFFIIILFVNFLYSECSSQKKRLKILVYSPGISWSHTQFLGKIADTLQEAGHEVHFLKFVSSELMASRNETNGVHKIHLAYPRPSEENSDEFDIQKAALIVDSFSGERPILSSMKHPWHEFLPFLVRYCKEVALNRELLDALNAEYFDVGISELYDICPFAIFHRIGVRKKLASTAIPIYQMAARHFGIPTFSSFVPTHFPSNDEGPSSGFFGRLLNFYADFYEWAVVDRMIKQSQEPMLKEIFGPEFPELEEIVRNVSLYFVNSNPFFEMPRPISNKIVHIGGLVSSRQKKSTLDKKMQQILDSASEGAILISFGSLAESNGMSVQMRHSLLRAFGHFPSHQFIWKIDNGSQQSDSTLLSTLSNVHTYDWVQQSAILAHPKLEAFITHCGWNSVSEAAKSGVPILGVPLFADQFYNALVAKHKGMGMYLDVKELNGQNAEEIMESALKEILQNSKYRQNAQIIQRKLALTPFSARDNLIRWVEFAANFPDLNELNLPTEIGWFIYYSLDSILFTFTILMAIFILAGWIITKIARLTLMNSNRKLKEQ